MAELGEAEHARRLLCTQLLFELIPDQYYRLLKDSAVDDPSVSQSVFTITGKAPTRAFSWLKAPTSALTFKTLLRHYAKWALTPR